MLFGRFLHPSLAPRPDATGGGDTEAVRRIVEQLESLPPEQAAHLAGFAYILARVVSADPSADVSEVHELETLVAEFGGVPEALAVVVVEIARSQSRLVGATEDYLVTRRFREVASDEERQRLLHCLFAVATPGERTISAAQNAEIHEIADELGFTLDELNEVRRGYADRLAVVRYAREAAGQAGAGSAAAGPAGTGPASAA